MCNTAIPFLEAASARPLRTWGLVRNHHFPLITPSETQSPGSSFLRKTSLTCVSKTSCLLHYLHLSQTVSPSSPCFLLSLFCLHSLLKSPKLQQRHLFFKNSLYLVKSYVHLILRELNVSYFMIFCFKIKNKKTL